MMIISNHFHPTGFSRRNPRQSRLRREKFSLYMAYLLICRASAYSSPFILSAFLPPEYQFRWVGFSQAHNWKHQLDYRHFKAHELRVSYLLCLAYCFSLFIFCFNQVFITSKRNVLSSRFSIMN